MRKTLRKTKKTNHFILSILTAVVVGSGSAFIGIEGYKTWNQPAKTVDLVDELHGEEDPTFISKFSRVFMYDVNKEAAVKDAWKNLPESSIGKINEPITALAYNVTNLSRNSDIMEKNADTLLPIASVTKLVTAVVARKLMDEDKEIVITKDTLKTEGNTGYLKLGEKFKMKELLYPLLMVSSNDAAEALARAYGRKDFIKEMNNWTNSIGAYRTYFKDSSGLSPQNVSTASDLSVIAKWIKENEPDIFDITLAKNKSIRTHTWINPTHFLNLSTYAGGKNGYIPEADRTSVSLFSVGWPREIYSVVLLGSKQRDTDMAAVLNQALR